MTLTSFAPGADSPPGESLPPSVDLAPEFERWGLRVRPQGDRGTCSVFAVVGALEYALAARADEGVALSVEFLNWAGHRATGRTVDGGFFWELWDGYEQFGICAETDLPYADAFDVALEPADGILSAATTRRGEAAQLHWVKEWDPETGLTEAELQDVRRSLAAGHPVCGGFRWPKKPKWDNDLLAMAPPSEVFDGHSILLSGYADDAEAPGGGRFAIRNSSAAEASGSMSYEYVREYMNDAAWIEPAE
jgi:hypothetical protein